MILNPRSISTIVWLVSVDVMSRLVDLTYVSDVQILQGTIEALYQLTSLHECAVVMGRVPLCVDRMMALLDFSFEMLDERGGYFLKLRTQAGRGSTLSP